MGSKSIDLPFLHRSYPIEERAIDEVGRTVTLSFSSETEVERSFGREILDHSPDSVDLSRIRQAAPLLVNHDWDDHVGVVESASVGSDRKGRAVVRFGNSARAKEIFQDVKDRIRSLVSVGYWVNKMQPEKRGDGLETYRVTSWTPLEISIVSVPADTTVGVGRDGEKTRTATISGQFESNNMSDTLTAPAGQAASPSPGPNIREIESAGQNAERKRIIEISAIGKKFGERTPAIAQLADRAVAEGLSVADFQREAFGLLPGHQEIKNPNPMLGVPERDLSRYSFQKAIMGAGDRTLDGLEKELSDECSKRTGRSSDGVMIPHDVLAYGRRDLVKATASLGGNLVATDLLAGSFIELLRNRMMIAKLGATSLNGLVGDVAIPRRSGGATAYWVTEVQSTTESDATFDQVTLTPKCVTALQQYSRKLLIQGTPDVEGLVRTDLATCLALAIDLAALHGTGTEQPTGIIGVSGIGDVAGGTDGAAPTWGNVVDLETEVAIDNADIGTLAYLTNAKVRGKLKKTARSTAVTDFIWDVGPIGDGFGMINGYRAGVTNQVKSNLTKGTSTTIASAIFFGNWSDLLIGNWAGLDILVDPYTNAATRLYNIYVNQYVDVAVRHPQSFSAMKDALTT